MATSHTFNNRVIKLPGAYSTVRSLSPSTFNSATYSKVLIVNTDPNLSFGAAKGSAGIGGTDFIYSMRSLSEAQSFLRSGYLWNLTRPLFIPSRSSGTTGISQLYYVNALNLTAPTMKPTLTAPAVLEIECFDEGTTSNATVLGGDKLISGYALSIIKGVRDPSKFIVQIWRGTFKGLWSNDSLPFDGVLASDTVPELVIQSSEISTVTDFNQWATLDKNFNQGFRIKTSTAGSLTEVGNSLVLAIGGTSAVDATKLEEVLDSLKELDFNVILSTEIATTTLTTTQLRLQYFVQNEVTHKKFLAIPSASATVADSITLAKSCNSENLWMIHGKPRKNSILSPRGYRIFDSLFLAAHVVGRIVGLPPQIPGTFKDLDIDGLVDVLTDFQKEDLLDGGVLTVHYDVELEAFTILRAVNTLKANSTIQNPNGTSFSIQITRICAQLNQDLAVNAKKMLFGTNEGANSFTISPEYMKSWTSVFLESKVARNNQDNLIISFGDISCERINDAYYTSYRFETNTEIAFAFFTGFAVN